jgi:uncharacterized protein (TIGR02594 family)
MERVEGFKVGKESLIQKATFASGGGGGGGGNDRGETQTAGRNSTDSFALGSVANGSAAAALKDALKYEGMDENANTRELASFMGGWDPRGSAKAWCAQFVNSAMGKQGIKGTGSAVASSFLNWGTEVADKAMVRAGDVLVDHRGRRAGQTGAHVGMATGRTRMGANGLELEMFSGNEGNKAVRSWYSAEKLKVRRAAEEQKRAIAEGVSPTVPVKPGAAATMAVENTFKNQAVEQINKNRAAMRERYKNLTGRSSADPLLDPMTPQDLNGVPFRHDVNRTRSPSERMLMDRLGPSKTPQDLLQNVPKPATTPAGGAGGMLSAQAAPQVNITVNGAGQDPESLANKVQGRIQEAWNWRTHDVEHDLT